MRATLFTGINVFEWSVGMCGEFVEFEPEEGEGRKLLFFGKGGWDTDTEEETVILDTEEETVEEAPEGCWCDTLCTKFADCCPDFTEE